MKITYKFIKDLRKLLIQENWQENLEIKIQEIDEKLKKSPQEKLAFNKSKSKKDFSPQDEALQLKKIIARHDELKAQKSELTSFIQDGKYKLGVAPFEDIGNASLLLANIHILYSKDFEFEEPAVNAVKSMLEDNYSLLYKDNIDLQILAKKTVSVVSEDKIIEKFLSSQDIDEYDFVPSYDALTDSQKQDIRGVIKSIPCLNPDIVNYCRDIFKFASLFKYDYSIYNSRYILALSAYFGNTKDIDEYLSNTVDFSTLQALEGYFDVNCLINLNKLDRNEIKVWHKLNSQYGTESIKLFGSAFDIKKSCDIVSLDLEIRNDKKLLEKLKENSRGVKFERETEAPDIAELAYKHHVNEDVFNRILNDILPNKKDFDNLPEIEFNIFLKKNDKLSEYSFKKLSAGDSKALFLGQMTKCCQFIGGDSEKCVIDGYTRKEAGFYIIEDKKGKILAQSYAWIGINKEHEEVLVLDSFEYLPGYKGLFIPTMKNLLSKLTVQQQFTALYVGQGGKTPGIENKELNEMNAKDTQLHRYHDSKYLYEITKDVELRVASDDTGQNLYNIKEFIEHNTSIIWIKIFEEHEKILKTVEIHQLNHMSRNVVIIKLMLSHLSVVEVINVFKPTTNTEGNLIYRGFPNPSENNLKILQNIISSINITPTIDEIHNIIRNVENISPLILENISSELLMKFLSRIENTPYAMLAANSHLNFYFNTKAGVNFIEKVISYCDDKDDFTNIVKILNKASDIAPLILENISSELLMKFLHKLDDIPDIPYIISKYNNNIGEDSSMLLTYLENHQEGLEEAVAILGKSYIFNHELHLLHD